MDNGPERVSLALALWAEEHGSYTGLYEAG